MSAGLSQADGADVRVVFKTGTTSEQLARCVDPQSGWNRSNTKAWFRLPAALGADAATGGFFLYFGKPDAAAPDPSCNGILDVFEPMDAPPLPGTLVPSTSGLGSVTVTGGSAVMSAPTSEYADAAVVTLNQALPADRRFQLRVRARVTQAGGTLDPDMYMIAVVENGALPGVHVNTDFNAKRRIISSQRWDGFAHIHHGPGQNPRSAWTGTQWSTSSTPSFWGSLDATEWRVHELDSDGQAFTLRVYDANNVLLTQTTAVPWASLDTPGDAPFWVMVGEVYVNYYTAVVEADWLAYRARVVPEPAVVAAGPDEMRP